MKDYIAAIRILQCGNDMEIIPHELGKGSYIYDVHTKEVRFVKSWRLWTGGGGGGEGLGQRGRRHET